MNSLEKFPNKLTPKTQTEENNHSLEPPKISEEEFANQFKELILNTDNHEILYSKIEPSETVSSKFVIYLGGFAKSKEAYYGELKSIAQSGRKVLFTNQTRGIAPSEKDSIELSKLNLPQTIKNKVAEVIVLLDYLKIYRADIVGHSQGAIIGTIIAAMRPGIADNLILLNPAGLYDDDSSVGIVQRTIKGDVEHKKYITKTKDAKEKERLALARKRVKRSSTLTTDMMWRFDKEIHGLATTDIAPILKKIKSKQEDAGVDEKTYITLITANKDALFNSEKIEKHIGINLPQDKKDTEGVIDAHAMYIEKGASHNAPMYEKPGLITQILNSRI